MDYRAREPTIFRYRRLGALDIAEAMIEGQFTAVAAVGPPVLRWWRRHWPPRSDCATAPAGWSMSAPEPRPACGTGRRGAHSDLQLAAGAVAAAHGGRQDGPAAVRGRRRGRGDQAVRLVRQHDIGLDDVVIAVAASGTTPFTLSCLQEAKRRGPTIGIANNRNTPILKEADQAIWLDTGAEPIAGSTRMKAGTAQRITLNVFSSLVMILLGRVFDGLMADLQAVNQKPVQRSESILTRLTGHSREEAREALQRAEGNVKLAVLLLHGCDLGDATNILDRAGGQLRAALAAIGKAGPDPRDLSDLTMSHSEQVSSSSTS